MHSLHLIQKEFWEYLRNENTNQHNLQLANYEKLSTEKRLAIYRQTTRSAHINALANNYKCCETILGKKYFSKIASQYFYQHPATDRNLNNYGKLFPSYLSHLITKHNELADYPYLADLAKFEQIYESAYYAKDDKYFDFELISLLDEKSYANVNFHLSASLSILRSNFPIYEIWQMNKKERPSQDIDAIHDPQLLCVYREDYIPKATKISFQFWWVIKQIQNNQSLSQLENLAKQESVEIQFDSIIPQLIKNKWICSFSTE